MTITAGTRLGRYEIISPLGSGAMGEVYRARDLKIGRDVALKILPLAFSTDKDRLRRFELEAKAAGALNHPNLLAIYDVGTHHDSPYLVSELLTGRTLRDWLKGARLPPHKAVLFALQIARGLAAAHDKGIIHRDIKPENIFISVDEQVKILDFGLAKFKPSVVASEAQTGALTVAPGSIPGVIAGTANYMSPEQVRGGDVDHRSDIFSFGAILYELLTGKRAFKGDSPVEAMNAVLTEDPLRHAGHERLDPVLRGIVRHCLEKKPESRFSSMHDVTFTLESMSKLDGARSTLLPLLKVQLRWYALPALIVLVLLAAATLGFFAVGRAVWEHQPPSYRQLTFRRGTIWSARFTRDGSTIIYSAAIGGEPIEVFSTRPESTESRSLDLPNSELLAVSSTGEMAILLNRNYFGHFVSRGTLARVSLNGGAPREVLHDIQEADWSPDGSNLAVVRNAGGRNQLEYPVGNVLYEREGWISHPRVSPDGTRVAFFDHEVQWDNRGWVTVVDRAGRMKRLTGEWSSQDGLAWSPSGNEVWFTARRAGETSAIYSVTLSGEERVVERAPVSLVLHDIAPDGRVLLSRSYDSNEFIGRAPGEAKERNLSWLDRGRVRDLSSDGKIFIFTVWGEGSGTNYSVYLRKTDGALAVRLGQGAAWALSPDKNHVLTVLATPPQLALLPTGAGELKYLERSAIESYGFGASWLPDGRRVLFIGREPEKGMRCYVQDIKGGPPRPVTPERVTGSLISPDGKFVIAADEQQRWALYPLDGGEARPIRGLERDDEIIRWSDHADTVYVYRPRELPLSIFRLNLSTGSKKVLREVSPTDQAGILPPMHFFLTPDGDGYIYDFRRYLSVLYMAEGLR